MPNIGPNGIELELAAGAGGADVTTASNGLTEVGDDIKLGGTLTELTSINTGSLYDLSIRGTKSNGYGLLIVDNTGDGRGITSTAVNAPAIEAFSVNGIGVIGASVNDVGLLGSSTNNAACQLDTTPDSTNSVVSLLRLFRSSTGLAQNGIGASINILNKTTQGGGYQTNTIISKWTDVTHASRTSEFSITGVNNAITDTLLSISGAGIFTLPLGLQDYANDAAEATGGIPINGLYRNGSTVQIRVS